MQNANQIIKEVKNKQFKPIYFLMGDEPYYIDLITKTIDENVIPEEQKGFNQTTLYGKETNISSIIGASKRFPMMADNSLVIVKEAQHLSRTIDELIYYVENPLKSTVLVLNYKYKTLDKRKKITKILQEKGFLFESKKLYDNQLPDWIETYVSTLGLKIETKAKFMIIEFIGNDLNRIANELSKLKLVIGNKIITAELVENNIGISKQYNNFELQKAICNLEYKNALKIALHFDKNTKNYPSVITLSMLYNFFSNLITYHSLQDKTKGNIAKELKINPFFVSDYQQAARVFPLKKTTKMIALLREFDMKSKGVGSINLKDFHKELILRIFNSTI